jgi:hypothetical protein
LTSGTQTSHFNLTQNPGRGDDERLILGRHHGDVRVRNLARVTLMLLTVA